MDCTEFLLAKGRVRTPILDGQLLLVQLDDATGANNLIPEFPTWAQCFAIFTAVSGAHNPALITDLMMYLTDTATHAKRFRWPSRVIYDQNFRQDLAHKLGLCWQGLRNNLCPMLHEHVNKHNWSMVPLLQIMCHRRAQSSPQGHSLWRYLNLLERVMVHQHSRPVKFAENTIHQKGAKFSYCKYNPTNAWIVGCLFIQEFNVQAR